MKLMSHIEEDGNRKAFWRNMHMRWKGKDINMEIGNPRRSINVVTADTRERKTGSENWKGKGKEREIERERKREKAQYEEQKYEREREETGRRKRDRESRGPSREDRDRYNDRSSRQRRFDDLDDDGHAYHRRCETDNERDRTASLLKFEKQKTQETESEKPERDEVEQKDYQEKIAFQLAQQEEEEEDELDRIKEESRRRRQAILEKYKNQPSQKSGDNAEVHANQSTEKHAAGDRAVSEPVDGPTNGADVHGDEPTFSSGKSYLQGGHNADEKASGAGGLGQCTPEFSTEELVKTFEKKIERLQQQSQFSTEELVKELSKQIENFEQHQQEHEDGVKQQFPTEELVKELAKQIEYLQQHQPEYNDQVKQQSERSADMFCDDIFGESPAAIPKMGKGDGMPTERNCLPDNWNDPEGYYIYRFGEILDGRYEILAAHGKGVFSTVVRAKDLKARPGDPTEVAIKIIRNNDTMYKAGMEELIILKKLVAADPKDKRRCVHLISSFKYRNHLCLVFESLWMNLRELQKKFGRNIGLSLDVVRLYARQLFSALKHLKSCGVLHCDIKPDNILVNEAKDKLKLCDFGNAMFAGKNEITPYLVSRFYRAPEIILGLSYDHPMDIWSVGCCLFELYSGEVLFPGRSNNDMLRFHMELKGPFPKKMLRKGAFTYQHFDQDLNFLATEENPVTKKAIRKLIVNIKPKDISSVISGDPGEELKMLAHFKDLMERIFVLDPLRRITVSQALEHPFITKERTTMMMISIKAVGQDSMIKILTMTPSKYCGSLNSSNVDYVLFIILCIASDPWCDYPGGWSNV
ncbi:serine/threonine-protein kinase PRP4 homolog [Solanum pennellii]|uniref:non-specific serine/threonine protein kinase n=1 Tax=Solanum pennellii TaxID=28526 RepID=A0ABM1VC11_SOLPN|nr:serine/threonine-protein kinase PRP4 homolog [Solanum pennellii]XP_027773279.1 serine/threonine-protein kinase PRP4 homolog [Solanum pennellii]